MSSEKFKYDQKNGQPENSGRRGFLKAAAALTGGALFAKVGVEFAEHESEVDNFYERFKGKEDDIEVVNEAVTLLLNEMNEANLESLRLTSGPGLGFGTEHIDILRDFITAHLLSPIGSKYSFRDDVIKSGVYTREILVELLSATTR